jgi:flavin-dependent dehydrogenase
MIDVLIAGAGPAGAVAGLVLARAGARVVMIDRAEFPRDKLCGDTINPGARALLRRLGVHEAIERAALPLSGMVVTGEGGVEVTAAYGGDLAGLAIARRDLDVHLVGAAVAAGASLEHARVGGAVIEEVAGVATVRGLTVAGRAGSSSMAARVSIAADGRRSVLAFGLGLARHPVSPRRWAIGAHFEAVAGLSGFGEMHVRPTCYLGVAPLPGGLANACLVCEPRPGFDNPARLLETVLASDSVLATRFARARRVSAVTMLGPLAVEARAAGMPGLLLAGDAAGFVDPMTGDGLRFAIEGGWLAAEAALAHLQDPHRRAWAWLGRRRRASFGPKRSFNGVLRRIVSSKIAVRALTRTLPAAPLVLQQVVALAGDVGLARRLARADPVARPGNTH